MSLGLLPIAGGEYTEYTRKRRAHSQDPCAGAARTRCSDNVLGHIKVRMEIHAIYCMVKYDYNLKMYIWVWLNC